jgi:Uma2 family endonuclease
MNMNSYTLNFDLSEQQFQQICDNNPELKFELNTQGDLIIMSPTGGETGNYNAELTTEFVIWNRQKKLGKVFDSSTCFKLPIGSNRSPDVAWITLERWEQLTPEQRQTFPPIAPDFVLELMSPTDNLKDVQDKMQEYLDSGVKLGWLINPKTKIVEIYRQGQTKEVLENPRYLYGENILVDFILDLTDIWGQIS